MGNWIRKYSAKVNIPLCAAAVLLCLTLVSAYSVTGLYARYTTSAQSSSQARVAKFSITGAGALSQPIEAKLVPGGSQTVELIIKNDSEVAVAYTVTVANKTKNLPLTFQLEAGGASPTALETQANEDGVTFTAQQLPGSHIDKYQLTIQWPANGDEDYDPARMGMVDYIAVTVTAAQID